MRGSSFFVAVLLSQVAGCNKPSPKALERGPERQLASAQGNGESDKPPQGSNDTAQPVEVGPPNVPEFRPEFEGQTRAAAVHTKSKFRVKELAGPFERPWAIAFLPDGRMLITEKHVGRLLIVNTDGTRAAPVVGVPKVDGRDQGGLLDVELSPTYAQDKLVYLSYYEPREGGNGLAVARFKLEPEEPAKLSAPQIVFRMMPTLDSTKHAGGRLVFSPDGTLFVTLGERSILEGRKQARDLKSHLGKVVRIRPDGTVPPDNPFVGDASAKPEIWTLGHRNVLGADLDAKNRLWVAEMGPRGGDELNLVIRGKDYGWPTIGYGEEYTGASIHKSPRAPGLEQPIYYWDPVISPGALMIYKGDLFPEWKGNFFIAGLSSQALVRLVLDNDRVVGEERLLTDRGARIREVVQGREGALYLLTDGEDGKLLQVLP